MFPLIDTRKAEAVAAFVVSKFESMFPDAESNWSLQILGDIDALFAGRHPDYQAVDLKYHDFEHTMQATVCLVHLLEGRHAAGAEPVFGPRQFQLAIAAVLLHDTGYLKLRSDTEGTGAKYTFCHVLRSCAFAAAYLPRFGLSRDEIEDVMGAINYTGPTTEPGKLYFREASARSIGCALGTADFLSQMAAPEYPDELEFLFQEIAESDDFVRVPMSKRTFQTAEQLIERTPLFWELFVRRRLEVDYQGVYHFLDRPLVNGSNGYVRAVERNIAEVRRRAASHFNPGLLIHR